MPRALGSREFIPALQITTKEIQQKIQSDLDRRVKFLNRKKVMMDDFKSIIDLELSTMFSRESFEDMRPYIDVSMNFAKRICSELATVYSPAPERSVTPKASQKRYESIIGIEEGLNLDGTFAHANYLLNGLNDLIFQVVTTEGFIDLLTITPDQVSVFENPQYPSMLDAILIEDAFTNIHGQKEVRYVFWSPVRHFILDENFREVSVPGNPEKLNPYWQVNMEQKTFYPFFAAHNGIRKDGFWDQKFGNDMFEATKLIAIKNTFLYFMFPMQFKQLSAKGIFDDKTEFKNRQIKSPLHIMKSNQELEVLDWQSKILELSDHIQQKIFQVASTYGVSPENFKLTADQASGFALMVSKQRLNELREAQTPTWRATESEAFNTVRVVNNVNDLEEIAEAAKFSIDFAEPELVEDPKVVLEIQDKRIEMGLTNPLEIIKQENPDIKTDEEAEEFFNKNIEIRDRLRQKRGTFAGRNLLGQPQNQPAGAPPQ